MFDHQVLHYLGDRCYHGRLADAAMANRTELHASDQASSPEGEPRKPAGRRPRRRAASTLGRRSQRGKRRGPVDKRWGTGEKRRGQKEKRRGQEEKKEG